MTETQRKQIGQRVAQLRSNHNMSRHQLAQRFGRTYQWVWNIETGARAPSLSSISALADAFGVSTDDLLSEAPNAN